MDKPISVGDLVQIVKPKPCCGYDGSLGRIFAVVRFGKSNECGHCGALTEMQDTVIGAHHDAQGVRIFRVKRIPPLSELEGEKRDEEITA